MLSKSVLTLGLAAISAALAACQVDGEPPAYQTVTVASTTPISENIRPGETAQSVAGMSEGEALYKQHCAACHENTQATRAPTRESLQSMNFRVMNFALTGGKMKAQAAGLSVTQRAVLVNYLIGREGSTTDDWADSIKCAGTTGSVNITPSAPVTSAGFGITHDNNRKLTAQQAGLTTAQLSNMELAWTIAVPEASTMRSMGPVVGKTIFWPATDLGQVHAIDISGAKPCVHWTYTTPGGAPLRSSVAYGVLADGTPLLVVSGVDATVHALDARTGKPLWTKNVAYYSFSMTTGTPVVLKNRVIVPVSQGEITAGADSKIECCTNHGFVLSLDPKTGAQQWRYDTMPDATAQRDRGDGKPLMGPSGAPIWNSPAIDEKRGLVYFGTGESNSPPAHRNTNALIAIGLEDGKERWSFHATPNDIYNSGCGLNPSPELLNCTRAPETVFRDVDFGGSSVLGRLRSGTELMFSGQKSGSVWALEPETGKVVWRTVLGTGGPSGGVHWGVAFDNDMVYAPIFEVGQPIPGEWDFDPSIKPGLYALDATNGKIKWQFNPEPPAGIPSSQVGTRSGWRGNVFSAVPVVIDGAVISAAMDGTVFVNDKTSGALLWSYQTARDYEGVNGAKGAGGSIDSNSILAANGLLLVNSGYGTMGKPGNVLLAFKPTR